MKPWRVVVWGGAVLVLAGLPVLQRMIILPLYQQGTLDWFFSMLNRVSAMVVIPGKRMAYGLIPPVEHRFNNLHVGIAFGFNLFFYGTVIGALMALPRLIASRKREDSVSDAQDASSPEVEKAPNPDRRQFLRGSVAMAGLAVCSTYPVLVSPGRLTVRREQIGIRGLHPSLAGLTIAQVTDCHHDEWISLHHIRSVVERTNSLQPDIVALTGDYITSNPAFIRGCVAALSGLRPRVGCVAVLGNHDWWGDVKETRAQFDKYGIPLIDNDRMILTYDRRLVKDADAGLCFAGVGDLWEDEVDVEKALRSVPDRVSRVLLSHNPDIAERRELLESRERVDLVLSGHTHGGQVWLPGIGTPIVPSAFGRKYAQGLVEGPVCPVQISAGVGMAMLPVRVNVPPEIVLMTLVPA